MCMNWPPRIRPSARRAAFDIPIEGEDETDETIPQAAPVPAPEPIAVDEPEKADPFGDILSLIRNKPEKKKDTAPAGPDPEDAPEPIEDDTPPWEAEPISKAEQKKQEARENAALAAKWIAMPRRRRRNTAIRPWRC